MPAQRKAQNKKRVELEPPRPVFVWERLPDESSQAYSAFLRYRTTPIADRSYRKLGLAHSLVCRWAAKYRWRDRTQAHDDYLFSLSDEVSAAASLRHRSKAARYGDRALDVATRALDSLNPAKLSSGAIGELATTGTALARAALAIPDAPRPGLAAAGSTVQVGVVWGGESPAWLPSAKLNETQVERNSDGRVKVLANGVPGPLPVHAGSPAEGQIVDVTPEIKK